MGLSARQLDAMTLWEFSAAHTAWIKFHASSSEEEAPPAMSDDRLAELGIAGFS
jgi:hypothetical protein